MKKKEKVFTSDLRDVLKTIMQNEIEKLPETLEALEPKERVNAVCKLMPYVFPKVDTVHPTADEPINLEEAINRTFGG